MPSDTGRPEDDPPVRLQIRLLGAVEVTLDDERLRAFDSLRLQRFLGLLVLRSDLSHRARLAFELWPDSDEGQARTNLRKLLHDVRRALPDADEFVTAQIRRREFLRRRQHPEGCLGSRRQRAIR